MKQEEVILDDIIKDGSADIEGWPDLLQRLLSRLDNIVNDNFPKPTLDELHPPDVNIVPSQFSTQPSLSQASTQLCNDPESAAAGAVIESQSSPQRMPPPPSPPASLLPSSSSLTEVGTPPPPPSPPLHPADVTTLSELKQTLENTFVSAPPHTVQRLAELLRNPNIHYRSLPKYLRALQRVLSVSSPSTAFPLPQNQSELNGQQKSAATTNGFSLGSDESLGGALLTPIPWLREDAGGEGHALSPEATTVPVMMVREQNEAAAVVVGHEEGVGGTYAKGPPGLGAEDVGPQPEGTVFPDPPKSEQEIGDLPTVGGVVERKDEDMGDAPKEEKAEQDSTNGLQQTAAGGDVMQIDDTTGVKEEAKKD